MDWLTLFNDLVLHQRELANKAIERASYAHQYLFPDERRLVNTYIQQIETGRERFAAKVREENSYIDFGSGRVEPIVGAHGQASAIIHFLESTNRAVADFQRYLDSTVTPDAVEAKCEALPLDQCGGPCRPSKGGWLHQSKCRFDPDR